MNGYREIIILGQTPNFSEIFPPWYEIALPIGGLIFVVVALFLFGKKLNSFLKKRRFNRRAGFARNNGFGSRLKNLNDTGEKFLIGAPHFQRIKDKWEFSGILDRKDEAETIYIYDFIHDFQYGFVRKRVKILSQTVCQIVRPGMNLPDFLLKPEDWEEKIKDKFTHADINFNDFPGFSKSYVLTVADSGQKDQVRTLFRSEMLQFMEARPDYTAWGGGDTFLLYHPEKIVTDEAGLNSLLDDARGILELLEQED